MTHTARAPRRIAIVGGGITGLAAAYRLRELDPSLSVTLYEASAELGGVLKTRRRDGFLVEHSADMFITNKPWALDLCRRLGLSDALVETNAAERKSFVLCRGRLAPVPAGFQLMAPTQMAAVFTSRVLSLRGKLRLAAEPFIPARQDEHDESLASFVRRRLGHEAFERLVQPLVAGIYTADAEKLSMRASLRQFVDLEREHGSLVRGMRKKNRKERQEAHAASGARYGLFLAPREGMTSLVQALERALPAKTVNREAPIEALERRTDGWRLRVGGPRPEVADCDAVLIALPAPRAATLLSNPAPELAAALGEIMYASTVIAVGGFRRAQFSRPIEGFGFVVPHVEGRRILAVSYGSQKFPGRAPGDCVLLRVFVGGELQPELVGLPDDAVRRLVLEELTQLLGLNGEPLFLDLVRWNEVMPQYHVGHLDRVAKIESLAAGLPGLALAGNAFHGVGIPDCIHSAETAAARLLGR